jgi:hypothetical protein
MRTLLKPLAMPRAALGSEQPSVPLQIDWRSPFVRTALRAAAECSDGVRREAARFA